jgi:glutaminyl-tRNA synthetase
VSAAHAVQAEVRLYDRLFTTEQPGTEDDQHFTAEINPNALEVVGNALVEPSLGTTAPGTTYQFERLGYYAHDPVSNGLFHRTVGLKDEWANVQKRNT